MILIVQTTRNQSINRLLKTPTIVHAKLYFSVSSAISPFFWWLIWRLGLYATVSFLLKAQFMWRNPSSRASCVTNNWKRTIMAGSRVPYVFRSGFEATGFKLAFKKWAYNLSGDISISINKKNRGAMMMRWHIPKKSQFPYFSRPLSTRILQIGFDAWRRVDGNLGCRRSGQKTSAQALRWKTIQVGFAVSMSSLLPQIW